MLILFIANFVLKPW